MGTAHPWLVKGVRNTGGGTQCQGLRGRLRKVFLAPLIWGQQPLPDSEHGWKALPSEDFSAAAEGSPGPVDEALPSERWVTQGGLLPTPPEPRLLALTVGLRAERSTDDLTPQQRLVLSAGALGVKHSRSLLCWRAGGEICSWPDFGKLHSSGPPAPLLPEPPPESLQEVWPGFTQDGLVGPAVWRRKCGWLGESSPSDSAPRLPAVSAPERAEGAAGRLPPPSRQ